jgi:hypothetical protein
MFKAFGIVAATFFVAVLILAVAAMALGPGEPHFIMHGFDDHSDVGGVLGWLIAGAVMLLVGAILTVVFAGVSVLLVGVAILVAVVVLLALIPVLLPAIVILAIPFLAIYGFVKAVQSSRRTA